MGEAAKREMTPEEFLLWCLDQEDRYELVDGFPVKAADVDAYHDTVVVNVLACLGSQLRGTRCRVTTAAIALRTKPNFVRRPDAIVTCDTPPP